MSDKDAPANSETLICSIVKTREGEYALIKANESISIVEIHSILHDIVSDLDLMRLESIVKNAVIGAMIESDITKSKIIKFDEKIRK